LIGVEKMASQPQRHENHKHLGTDPKKFENVIS
jgi:hypothetical protein